MARPNSLKIIASKLHELSSITKLLIISVFWFVISFGQNYIPGLVFKNQLGLSIVMTLTFVTNLVTEIILYFKKKNYEDFHQVLSVQIIANTLLLMVFLSLFDHINGPLFLICTLTLMESSLNLNLTLPFLVVTIMGTSTVVEWALLVQSGQIIPDLLTVAALIVRIVTLVFLMGYGKSLSESIIAAREVDKMKDEFISIASHELRTPMTAIKSYLWMALNGRGGILKPKQKFYLQRSYDSTDRLIKLVNDMLNISRIESGRISLELDQVQILSLTKEVTEEFSSRTTELGVNLKVDSSLPPPTVIADADKIKEVFFNLIGNALKYTPKKGTITIDFHPENDFLITRITDTGSGMTPEMINNLFQKFGLINGSYQTNQSTNTKGTGLGLYICKQIITLHHGEIWGNSPGIGQGSVFSFSLPVYTSSKLKLYRKQFQHTSNVGIIHSKI